MKRNSDDLSRDETIGGVPTVPRGEPPMLVNGRYRTIRLIARGGMATVYLAEQLALHRPVALKILNPPPGADEEDRRSFEKRFQLEAETLATLVHPNIVTVYDYGPTEDGRYYLAMEYIEGPRFTDLLVRGSLPPDRAIQLLLQVCNALRYAHKRGVVHRDLKPSNLLIATDADGDELLKVVDFGLVKVGEYDQSLTREGVVMGSPHCMAPEQVQGGAIDPRTDIYALGVLLFRSLTGAYPFHGPNATATMMLHLAAEVPRFLDVAPDLAISPQIEAVVRRCLSRSPDDRYPDVASLAQELGRCIGSTPQLDTQTASIALDEPAPPPRRPAWLLPALVAGSVVVVVGGLLAAWLTSRPAEGPATAAVPSDPPATAPAPATIEMAPAVAASPAEVAPGAEAAGTPVEPPAAAPEAAPATAATPAKAPAKAAARPDAAEPAAEKSPAEPAPAEPPPGFMGLPDDLK